MSEVIENYIRRHPDLGEKEAFEGFLREERIKAWVGTDDSRKERLRKEFGRVWGSMNVEGQVASSARAGPSGPAQMQQPRSVRVDVTPAAVPAPQGPVRPEHAPPALHAHAHAAPGASARKLQVMCANCAKVNVWMQSDMIACRTCGTVYDDMLQLIRVTPVGPFEFLFGEGWKGAAVATGIGVGLVALYLLLRMA